MARRKYDCMQFVSQISVMETAVAMCGWLLKTYVTGAGVGGGVCERAMLYLSMDLWPFTERCPF